MDKLYILGCDPALANFGWCVLEVSKDGICAVDGGVIRTVKSKLKIPWYDDDNARVAAIADLLGKTVLKYKCVLVATEAQSWHPSRKGSVAVAYAVACARTIALLQGVAFAAFPPQEIKKRLTGSRSASKEVVMGAVVEQVPNAGLVLDTIAVASKQEHCSDAIGAALMGTECQIFVGIRKAFLGS
jgi:Holliday junction resolvasome RuvABC endonuclease subunit